MPTKIKICGLKVAHQAKTAVTLGADYLGFIFYPRSPRNLDADAWRELASAISGQVETVGVFVNADDHAIDHIMSAAPLDWIQLHGSEEPARVIDVKKRFGTKVMRALAIRDHHDIDQAARFYHVADRMLFDAKPSDEAASLPGGNGLSFDWRLLQSASLPEDWALAGGLDAENVGSAIALTGAPMVDVSTGVETSPGDKDEGRMTRFIQACRSEIGLSGNGS